MSIVVDNEIIQVLAAILNVLSNPSKFSLRRPWNGSQYVFCLTLNYATCPNVSVASTTFIRQL